VDLDLGGRRGDRIRLTLDDVLEHPQRDEWSFGRWRLEHVISELVGRSVDDLVGEGRLEPEAHVRLELFSRPSDRDAPSDRDGIHGRRVQWTVRYVREHSAVLLEPAVGLWFDGHVAGRVDHPVLIEGDLDTGIQRDVDLGVSRQRGDDAERLMRLERPRIEGPAVLGGERESIDRPWGQRFIRRDASGPSIDVRLDGEPDLGLHGQAPREFCRGGSVEAGEREAGIESDDPGSGFLGRDLSHRRPCTCQAGVRRDRREL
jgi:hypothetical protein